MYFVQYVRGSGRTTNVLFEIMLDIVSVSIIMIRFFIQNIRFIFIFMAFFELYEFIYFKLDVACTNYNPFRFYITLDNLLANKFIEYSYIELFALLFVQ